MISPRQRVSKTDPSPRAAEPHAAGVSDTGAGSTGSARDALHALGRAGIQWCLLRGEEALEQGPRDVDLLIASADISRACGILRQFGFQQRPSHAPALEMIRYDATRQRLVRLDLHISVSVAALEIPTSAILERAVERDGLYWPEENDEFWTLLLHSFIEHTQLRPAHVERLQTLARTVRPDAPIVRRVFARTGGWTPEDVIERVRRADWPAMKRFTRQAVGGWRAIYSAKLLRRLRGKARLVGSLPRRRSGGAL